MAELTDNMRGALLMAGAMTAFTVNDAFMKGLSDELPLFQAVFLRGTGVVICLTVLCALLGQLRPRLSRFDWSMVIVRGLAEIAGAYLFVTALFNMPIANVSAILQALPLTVSLAAAVVLGETLGWRRLTAIVIGFVGVLLIVQPGGEAFNIYALWAIGAVIVVTIRDLAARRMSRAVPSVFAALVAAVIVTIGAGGGTLFSEWQTVTPFAGQQLAAACVFIIGGYICSVAAMRVGEISFVAPFRYTSLLVALLLGYVFFEELPNLLAIAGAVIVVGTGLFTLYREKRARRLGPAQVFSKPP